MREFLQRHRAAILAFLGLTLPLFLLFVHGRHPRKTTVIEVALMEITGPVQEAASRALSGISDLWNGYVALTGLHDDNERLRGDVQLLTEKADRVRQLELENAELRTMLDFKKQRRELVTLGAHIIGKDVSPYTRVLRVAIDAGEDAHVLEGMPVINADGLIGRVHRVSSSFAEVMLVVDSRSTVNVKVSGKGVVGTVTGTSSQYSYDARMSYLSKAEPLAQGDLLVTSGHDKVFPPDLRVGYISSIEERQRGVEYELQVTPAVNFSDLDLVFIVTDVVSEPVERTGPGASGGKP
ncbi:MAG: rod shape-determining protein MreC [Deltaproteobacteria bacterium HGW-Deltaproteobacteria-14]|nr:MAG: rod shape-determining protein MreC [Deltaproteobacteria bacterium HGW-Deltaproteobacteria-14]